MSIKITISNYSKLAWERSEWTCGAGEDTSKGTFDELLQTPDTSLRAMDGMTTAEADTFMFGWLVQDCLYLKLSYKSGSNLFGVMISNNFQMFGIGTGVSWQYQDGSGVWHDKGTNSGGVTLQLNDCEVQMTPKLSRQEGSITVIIRNKAKA